MTDQPTKKTAEEVAQLAREHARARRDLEDVVKEIDKRRRKAVTSKIVSLKNRIATAAQTREALATAIEENPHLFRSPKTQVVDEVRYGMKRAARAIKIADAETTIRLIKSELEHGRSAALINITESPNRPLIKQMTDADLAKIGVTAVPAADEVLITVPKTEIDKLVDTLLKHGEDETKGDVEC